MDKPMGQKVVFCLCFVCCCFFDGFCMFFLYWFVVFWLEQLLWDFGDFCLSFGPGPCAWICAPAAGRVPDAQFFFFFFFFENGQLWMSLFDTFCVKQMVPTTNSKKHYHQLKRWYAIKKTAAYHQLIIFDSSNSQFAFVSRWFHPGAFPSSALRVPFRWHGRRSAPSLWLGQDETNCETFENMLKHVWYCSMGFGFCFWKKFEHWFLLISGPIAMKYLRFLWVRMQWRKRREVSMGWRNKPWNENKDHLLARSSALIWPWKAIFGSSASNYTRV